MRTRFPADHPRNDVPRDEENPLPVERLFNRLHVILPALFTSILLLWALFILVVPRPVFDTPDERKIFIRNLGGGVVNERDPIILVADWCSACRYLEKQLQNERISYVRGNIEANGAALELFQRASRHSRKYIPRVIVGNYVVPSNVAAIKQALNDQ